MNIRQNQRTISVPIIHTLYGQKLLWKWVGLDLEAEISFSAFRALMNHVRLLHVIGLAERSTKSIPNPVMSLLLWNTNALRVHPGLCTGQTISALTNIFGDVHATQQEDFCRMTSPKSYNPRTGPPNIALRPLRLYHITGWFDWLINWWFPGLL
jgi:hypothetical protein